MVIQLCTSYDEPNKLNKSLSSFYSLTGTLKDDVKISSPSILVEGNPVGYNYCYIPEFQRYYFIENVTVVRTNLFQIDLRVDVLMSNKEAINNMNGILEKTSNYNMDMFIDDGTFRFESKVSNEVVGFPHGFNENPDYILITAGGIV